MLFIITRIKVLLSKGIKYLITILSFFLMNVHNPKLIIIENSKLMRTAFAGT